MAWQLSSFVAPITGPLTDLQNDILAFTQMHREAHSSLLLQGTSLTQAIGSDMFVGSGATSFSDAIQLYITDSEQTLQLLDQAGKAAQTCVNDIQDAADIAAASAVDETILTLILGELSLEAVIQEGSSAITAVIQIVVNTVTQVGSFLYKSVTNGFQNTLHILGQGLYDAGELIHYAWIVLGDTIHVLQQWAEGIASAVQRCAAAAASYAAGLYYQRPHNLQQLTQAEQTFNKSPNAQTLANLTQTQETSNVPVIIQRVGNSNTLLVTLAGTDPTHPGEITNILMAIDAGAGDKNNPYLQYIESQIEQYIQQNHVQNAQIIVAGHSLGGIEAEYLAENNGTTNYTVSQVITFGSPQIGPPVQSVNYEQYFNQYDFVPLLSWYELGPIVKNSMILGPIAGVVVSLDTVAAINVSGSYKEQFIQEKLASDSSDHNVRPWQWLNDHNYSKDSSLTHDPMYVGNPSNHISAGQLDQIKQYSGSPQFVPIDLGHMGLQLGLGNILPAIPGIQPISIPSFPFIL